MGKISAITREQKIILDKIAQLAYFQSNFYFTGGTALSEIYLQHRESIDLDFFSFNRLDTQAISTHLHDLSRKAGFTFQAELIEIVFRCLLKFKNKKELRIDFSFYPYKQLKKGVMYKGMQVDSLLDIATNKVLTVSQRTEVKDYVDLFFLLKKFSIWDLQEGVHLKFNQEVEPYILASDLLAVEDFTFLPKMLNPLTLEQLRKFFQSEAIKLGSTQTE